jgi:hypothetical protein
MMTPDHGVAAVLYGPSRAYAKVAAGVPVELVEKTDFPFGDTVQITVNPESSVAFPLLFRVPKWTQRATATVNGKPVPVKPDAEGFSRIDRTWKAGDQVSLTFPMRVTVTQRETTDGSPFASVSYGPLLMALDIPVKDGDPNATAPDARYAFAIPAAAKPAATHRPLVRPWNWKTSPSPVNVTISAVPTEFEPNTDIPRKAIATGAPEEIRLVPFGSTYFRISMFPVVP